MARVGDGGKTTPIVDITANVGAAGAVMQGATAYCGAPSPKPTLFPGGTIVPGLGPKPTLPPVSIIVRGGDPNVTAAAMTVLDDKSRIIADKIALARAELAAIDAALARGYAKVNGTKSAVAVSANATAAALKSQEYAKLRDLRKRLEATFSG